MYLLMHIQKNNEDITVTHWCFADGESLNDVKKYAEKKSLKKNYRDNTQGFFTISYCKCSSGECDPISIYQNDEWYDKEEK